jgi:hypothetical protein
VLHQLIGVEAQQWHAITDQSKMKKQGFIKNKVMTRLVVINIKKANWISHIDVLPPTFDPTYL